MKIVIGCDHAGLAAKQKVIEAARQAGHEVADVGTSTEQSVDYPDYARLVAEGVARGEYERGILVCGSGIGMSIAANKVDGVRAALCWNEETARLSRQHNDANVLCLPGRFLDPADLPALVRSWLDGVFEGGRHVRRVEKIGGIEKERGCAKS